MIPRALTFSLTFAFLLAAHGPALAAPTTPGTKVRTRARTSQIAKRLFPNRLTRLVRVAGKKIARGFKRWANPSPDTMMMRLYAGGEISHSQIKLLDTQLRASGLPGMPKVVKATAPKAQGSDAAARMTTRLRAMADQHGWVD